MSTNRGSALIVSLVVTVGLSLLCLSLLLTTAGFSRGGVETPRERALAAADRRLQSALDELSRSPSGPSLELRKLALGGALGRGPAEAPRERWTRSERAPGMSVALSPPRFLQLSRPRGTDLRVFNQQGFFVERYALSSTAVSSRLKEPVRVEIELEGAISEADALFQRPRGRVIYVTAGMSRGARSKFAGDVLAIAPKDSVPSASLAPIPLTPHGRSPLWSASEVLARASSTRQLIRTTSTVSAAARSNALGRMAPGILVGRPRSVRSDLFGANGYARFAEQERDRPAVVYAPGSDGLVHAFDAGSGDAADPGSGSEIFAYSPRGLVSPAELDGSLSFEDAFLNASPAVGGEPCHDGQTRATEHCQWRTIVAGGLGRGGRSVFALDVTSPPARGGRQRPPCALTPAAAPVEGCADRYPKVLWEFEDHDDADRNGAPDLADTTSTPSFGRVRVRNAQTRRIEEHSVLIFGGGFEADGGARRDRSGNWLYVLDLESGATLYKSSFGVDASGGGVPVRRPFGAIASAVSALDLDQDGFTDTIYFGDLKGQLWKLTIPESDSSVAEYDPSPRIAPNRNRIRTTVEGIAGAGGWSSVLLFDGDRDGTPEDDLRIFHPPAVVRAGRTSKGELIHGVIWGTGGPNDSAPGAPSGRVVVLWDVSEGVRHGKPATPFLISGPNAPEAGTCRERALPRTEGWSLKLLPNETVSTNLMVLDGYVYVVTTTRDGSPAGSRLYRLDLETGDSCHGSDCCVSSNASWTAGPDRGHRIGGDQLSIVTGLEAFVGNDGALRIGLVAINTREDDPLSPSLISFGLPSPVVVRSRREP